MKKPEIYLLPMLLADETHQQVLTPYSIEVIKSLKVFFVENIRTTRRFISSLKAGIVIDDLKFYEVDKNTKFDKIFDILLNLKQDAGIISEAGCAGIADPGALVVEAGHQLGLRINPLVGPSSILLALMGSGFNGQNFAFHGYLGIKEGEREAELRVLEKEALKGQTQIFMETPYRNSQMVATLFKVLNPKTRLCIAASLTSPEQFIETRSIQSWRQKEFPDINKKPAIFLLN